MSFNESIPCSSKSAILKSIVPEAINVQIRDLAEDIAHCCTEHLDNPKGRTSHLDCAEDIKIPWHDELLADRSITRETRIKSNRYDFHFDIAQNTFISLQVAEDIDQAVAETEANQPYRLFGNGEDTASHQD